MILMVGAFPPPLHGMSAIHQALYERLAAEGMDVERISTSPASLKQDLVSRSSRWRGVLHAWHRLLQARTGEDQLYIAPSGRWGQVYDVVSLAITRLKKLPCVLHHHNYAYLERRRALAALMIWIAGPGALHVVLCEDMAKNLRSHYGVRKTLMLSNIHFSPNEALDRNEPQMRSVGFLSNLTREKGTEAILQLASAIQRTALPLHVIVAGPCIDPELKQKLDASVAAGTLEWRGAVYGEDKARFWRDIDVFVFPSETEAEPNVVWESLAAGVPVITYPRGCIQEQVREAGVLIAPEENFVSKAMEILENWIACPDEYRSHARSSGARYREAKALAAQQWHQLLETLASRRAVG